MEREGERLGERENKRKWAGGGGGGGMEAGRMRRIFYFLSAELTSNELQREGRAREREDGPEWGGRESW